MKTCYICKTPKHLSEFHKNSTQKDGYQQKCKACVSAYMCDYHKNNAEHIRSKARAWAFAHPEQRKRNQNKANRNHRHRVRKMVFDHYGNRCSCCGEAGFAFLTIDHLNNDGNKRRARECARGFYDWIVENDFPDDLQTLCRNCNWGRHVNKGICPHQEKK